MQPRQRLIPLSKPIPLKGRNASDLPVLRTLADAAFFLSATYNGAIIDEDAKALMDEIRLVSGGDISDGDDAVNAVSERLERFFEDRRLVRAESA